MSTRKNTQKEVIEEISIIAKMYISGRRNRIRRRVQPNIDDFYPDARNMSHLPRWIYNILMRIRSRLPYDFNWKYRIQDDQWNHFRYKGRVGSSYVKQGEEGESGFMTSRFFE